MDERLGPELAIGCLGIRLMSLRELKRNASLSFAGPLAEPGLHFLPIKHLRW
jgi:hypothetical protein